MFNYLLETQEEFGHGTHGYIKCAERARQAAVDQPSAAVAHGLLAALAEDFIDRNERMAVTSADTEAARGQFAAAIERLQKAYDTADASAILAALNSIAAQRYQQG